MVGTLDRHNFCQWWDCLDGGAWTGLAASCLIPLYVGLLLSPYPVTVMSVAVLGGVGTVTNLLVMLLIGEVLLGEALPGEMLLAGA